jgi:2-dehydro-3-deoxygalactonokinase
VLPGASYRGPDGLADVMRGEEVQVLGAASLLGLDRVRFCIPGTHAKWADYSGGMLTGFATYVTGEAFDLFRHHGLVGALADGDDFDRNVFMLAVERGSKPALLNTLFSARAEVLLNALAPGSVSSYLSGLVIGAELAAALQDKDDTPIVLLASDVMAERYTMALELFGISPVTLSSTEAKRQGLALVSPHVWPEAATQPA